MNFFKEINLGCPNSLFKLNSRHRQSQTFGKLRGKFERPQERLGSSRKVKEIIIANFVPFCSAFQKNVLPEFKSTHFSAVFSGKETKEGYCIFEVFFFLIGNIKSNFVKSVYVIFFRLRVLKVAFACLAKKIETGTF